MSSEVMDPNPDEDMLVLEPPPELKELEEFEAPMDDPEPELETPLLELLNEEVDVVAAIGTDTLLVKFELGRGRAIVTDWGCCSRAVMDEAGSCTWGRSREGPVTGALYLAVAGDIRTMS